MPVQPSLRARVADLIGEDPDAPRSSRLEVNEAIRRCGHGEVMAARDGDGDVAVVVLDDGAAYILADRCPHDGGLLSDGFVDGDMIVCARHGWEFDAHSGWCPARRRRVDSRSAGR